MIINRILRIRYPYYYFSQIKKTRPPSYGEYLQTEKVRNKEKRIKIISEWYKYLKKDRDYK